MANPGPRPARSLAELEKIVRLNCDLADAPLKFRDLMLSLLREAAQAQEPEGERLEWKPIGRHGSLVISRRVNGVLLEAFLRPHPQGRWGGYINAGEGECETAGLYKVEGDDPEALKADLLTRFHHLRRALG